jgi:hypothetical protein
MRIGLTQGIIAGVVALLLAMQLIRPARTNPPVEAAHTLEGTVAVPPAVTEILQRSCNDCHSDGTRWPWYSSVAPVSWLVVHDVNHGRQHLNFSRWLPPSGENPVQYTRENFQEACKSLQANQMPIPAYAVVHPQARLSQADVQTFCDWAENGLPRN